MKKGRKTLFLAGVLAALAVGACTTAYASVSTDAQEGRMPQDDGSVMAKVIEAGDDTLTVYLESKQEGEILADGETPPELPEGGAPADGETPPELPEGGVPADGETPPELTEGEAPADGHGGRGRMQFAESATALSLTDATVITKGAEQESASVSDLTSDTVVRLVLDGTTVVSINIMEMNGKG